ncbi:MAG TPA: DUF72 domain-containing protein [Thermoanaerobaculia bacterium]|nr:DUF72 domain-containing protein [Thermoanaerobaculia bacterium]
MSVKVGLCGFTIGAAAYFQTFPVVEVQQTFYDPPPARTLERWRAQAPPGFEFTMKAWQVITHLDTSSTYRRMKSSVDLAEAGAFRVNDTVLRAWETTRLARRILGATAILFQCPASFRATEENIENMRRFFTTVERPRNVRLLWEPRGPWPDDLVLSLCRELTLTHATDPFVRPSLTPELVYWRLHGNGSHYAKYTDAELQQLRDWITPGAETYVMFNNIPRVDDAQRFLASP